MTQGEASGRLEKHCGHSRNVNESSFYFFFFLGQSSGETYVLLSYEPAVFV